MKNTFRLLIVCVTAWVCLHAQKGFCDIYEPFKCDGERIPPLGRSHIDPRWIVDQKQTGTCFACSTVPALMSINEQFRDDASLQYSLPHLVLLGSGKKSPMSGDMQPDKVLRKIQNNGYVLHVDEGFDIQQVFDLQKAIEAPRCSQLDTTQCCRLIEPILPPSLRQQTEVIGQVLKQELEKDAPRATYNTLEQTSARKIQVPPFNVYVYSPTKGPSPTAQIRNKLYELVGPDARPKTPVMFTIYDGGGHALSISDIRIVCCKRPGDKYNCEDEVHVINNWGPGRHNGWFRAKNFLDHAHTVQPPITYIKRCEVEGSEPGLEKCRPFIQGSFQNGEQPLHYEVRQGNIEGIKALLQAGVDINTLTASGTSVLDILSHDDLQMIRFLLDNGVRAGLDSALHSAIRFNRVEVARLLLEKGANLNSVDKFGRTLVDQAREFPRVEPIAFLIDHGLNVDLSREGKKTLLQKAIDYHLVDVVKLLLDRRSVNLNRPNKEGKTPLQVAADSGQLEMVKLLVGAGADRGVPEGTSIPAVSYVQERPWIELKNKVAGGFTPLNEPHWKDSKGKRWIGPIHDSDGKLTQMTHRDAVKFCASFRNSKDHSPIYVSLPSTDDFHELGRNISYSFILDHPQEIHSVMGRSLFWSGDFMADSREKVHNFNPETTQVNVMSRESTGAVICVVDADD